MIKVTRHPSFAGYFEIYDEHIRIEEIQVKLKAKRYAMKLAKKLRQTFFLFLNESIKVE